MQHTSSLELPDSFTTLHRSARRVALKYLARLETGTLTLIECYSGQAVYHAVYGNRGHGAPDAEIHIHHPHFFYRLLKGGSIAAAEAYMDGWWSSTDLTGVMELMAKNLNTLDSIEQQSGWLSRGLRKLSHWLKRNSLAGAKENIHAHYDLGNDLYQLFLDEQMLYSSAVYLNENEALEQAQNNKMERLCRQLRLSEQDHVIEIGTGWGAMAIYMARHYGCRVTTTTISEAQFDYTQRKVESLGLGRQIKVIKKDYRLLSGSFDKLISVEMIEAVGKVFLPSYIEKCHSLLKPGGLMAIQAITIADQRYDNYCRNVDFIQKYIFPGGFLPSVTALIQTATKHSDLVPRDLCDIGLDYAQTLAEWRRRFDSAGNELAELGYDEKFRRMWRYYLCYCEGGFLARSISTVQMTFQKG